MEPADGRTSSDSCSSTHDLSFDRSPHSEDADAEKSLLDKKPTKRENPWRTSTWSIRVLTIATFLNIVLFSISIIILMSTSHTCSLSTQDLWRATSHYSPVFDRFSIPRQTLTTNGTFWNTSPPSIWRQRTGAAADAAWDAIGSHIAPIIINSSEVLALGKDPAVAVKAPASLNYGPDAYIAGMDVFHHLHCLDKLRREISYSHYHEKEEGPRPGSPLHEAHIDHCVDVLSQALRCTSSVDMVTFNWVEGHGMPQPDFGNKKVCRDFEALRDWTVDNGVDSDRVFEAMNGPPDGAVVLKEFNPLHQGEKRAL
jgi:hypothetical protein